MSKSRQQKERNRKRCIERRLGRKNWPAQDELMFSASNIHYELSEATLNQNSNTAMRERDRHIRAIERHGRREWYKLSGFTKRSMVENAVYRYKAIIGSEMRARTLARQRVEHRIGCEILNKMAALGMPDTYCAG